ncbi:MAG: adenylate/guanylate cyclase domain-containing protein [Fimbriimonadaceae bacterium]
MQILLQSLLIGLNIVVSISIIGIVVAATFTKASIFDSEFYRRLLAMIQPESALVGVGLGMLLALTVNGGFAISKKLGPGVLWNWITGKYYSPREEELVVMFLDMKDSTTIAESLGTLRFSALIRDFFSDLTGPLKSTGARVSHYIGDEAVIYWHPQTAFKKCACLRLVSAFNKVLEAKGAEYVQKYGFVPEFKAGAHIGMVVATEVGDVKSEVVFHGDTLNTAARIQGLCGDEDRQFLISGELVERIDATAGGIELESLGERVVKGRAQQIELYAVVSRSVLVAERP